MVSKRFRIPVVLDTNVLVRALKSRSPASPNRRVVRYWLIRRQLQLIVAPEVVEEYLRIFQELLHFDDKLIDEWRQRFVGDARTSVVNLGKRFHHSRDPDDNLFLATAAAGRAKYLLTNDRDLLDLPAEILKSLRFRVLTPVAFLTSLEENDS